MSIDPQTGVTSSPDTVFHNHLIPAQGHQPGPIEIIEASMATVMGSLAIQRKPVGPKVVAGF